MELLFIIAFAAAGMYEETRKEFKDWGHRKLDATRSHIAAKRVSFRPGGTKRSRFGKARLRDFPARSWWAFADVTWSLTRALRNGAKQGAETGRERYRNRAQSAEPDQAGTDDTSRGATDTSAVDQDDDKATNDQPVLQWRPTLVPPSTQAVTAAAATITGGTTMSDAGSFEQVAVMLKQMEGAALFALDDAKNDLKRAQEDASDSEAMVAFSRSITAGPSYETPLAATGETSAAMTVAKEAAVAAAEAHVAAIGAAKAANLRMME